MRISEKMQDRPASSYIDTPVITFVGLSTRQMEYFSLPNFSLWLELIQKRNSFFFFFQVNCVSKSRI